LFAGRDIGGVVRRTNRKAFIAMVVVAMSAALAGCGSSKAPTATSTTTTTTPAMLKESGFAYAMSVLVHAALPRGAEHVTRLPTPLTDGIAPPPGPGSISVHRFFLLAKPVDMKAFVAGHTPHDASSGGSEWGPIGPHDAFEAGYAVTLPSTTRHSAYVEVDYTVGPSTLRELRVDAYIWWAPIRTVYMPLTGTIILTAYRKLSDANPSSEPVSLRLSEAMAARLRSKIEILPNVGSFGLFCMESSTLFTITVARAGIPGPVWTASAVDCPNVITAVGRHGHPSIGLGDSCSLRLLVVSMMPKVSSEWRESMVASCPLASN
jgi:hypothetical protein